MSTKVSKKIPPTVGFLHGVREIAHYMRVGQSTVIKWRRESGLPLMRIMTRKWMTTTYLLDAWVLASAKEVECRCMPCQEKANEK